MNLAEWQKRAHEAIRGSAPLADGVVHERAGFAVYIRSFPYLVRTTLEGEFPLLLRLVGKASFRAFVEAYLEKPRGYCVELGAIAPRFFAFLESRGEAATVLRAARLDRLADEAMMEAEPAPGASGLCFGLHPSARFLEDGKRRYVLWRQGGLICRERISSEELRLLRCFTPAAELAEISHRLERSGLGAELVQEKVAVWSASGVIGAFP